MKVSLLSEKVKTCLGLLALRIAVKNTIYLFKRLNDFKGAVFARFKCI